MENQLTTILRSDKWDKYFLSVKQTLFSALDINARNPDSVLNTLLMSSLTNSYVEGRASDMGLCGQTVRNNLRKQDPDALLQLNDEIINKIKGKYLRKPLILAIDWHDKMYYGDPEAYGVMGTQPKKGTHWAYEFGSISVTSGKCNNLTLAVTPITRGERKVDHVRRLLDHVFRLGLKVKLLLLDAGYYSVDVINYLNSAGIKFIMRMPDMGAIRAGSDFMYTSNTHRHRDKQATFRVVAMNGKDRYGHSELFIFATNTDISPSEIRKVFRKRWRIEASYRMINNFLPRTTSKLYSVRKLYFYLAVLLCNVWAIIKRERNITAVDMKLIMIIEILLQNIYFIDDGG